MGGRAQSRMDDQSRWLHHHLKDAAVSFARRSHLKSATRSRRPAGALSQADSGPIAESSREPPRPKTTVGISQAHQHPGFDSAREVDICWREAGVKSDDRHDFDPFSSQLDRYPEHRPRNYIVLTGDRKP